MKDVFENEYSEELFGLDDNGTALKGEGTMSNYIYVVECEEQLESERGIHMRGTAEYTFDTPEEARAFMASRLTDLGMRNDKIKIQWGDESNKYPPVYLVTNSMSCEKCDKDKYEEWVEHARAFGDHF